MTPPAIANRAHKGKGGSGVARRTAQNTGGGDSARTLASGKSRLLARHRRGVRRTGTCNVRYRGFFGRKHDAVIYGTYHRRTRCHPK